MRRIVLACGAKIASLSRRAEQDNAPGGSADPGRSLRFTEFSAYNMVNLRG